MIHSGTSNSVGLILEVIDNKIQVIGLYFPNYVPENRVVKLENPRAFHEALEKELLRCGQLGDDIVLHFGHSPCGHSAQYAYSKDGGKHIVCLLCEFEAKKKRNPRKKLSKSKR